eukprot:352223-Chlamydomonas_euryale.AAC.16
MAHDSAAPGASMSMRAPAPRISAAVPSVRSSCAATLRAVAADEGGSTCSRVFTTSAGCVASAAAAAALADAAANAHGGRCSSGHGDDASSGGSSTAPAAALACV